MKFPVVVRCIVAALLGPLFIFGQEHASPRPQQMSRQELRSKARDLIAHNSQGQALIIVAPIFDIQEGTLKFKPGRAFVRADKYPALVREPTRTLLQAQLQLDILRDFLSSNDPTVIAFWKPYLDGAESTIGVAADGVRGAPQDDKATEMTSKALAQVDGLYESACIKFAVDKHLTYPDPNLTRSKSLKVTFRPDPPGAEIYIVQGFLFKAAGGSLDDAIWMDVTHGNEVSIPAGDWEYRARWNAQQPWQHGLVPIDADGPYNIHQKPQ